MRASRPHFALLSLLVVLLFSAACGRGPVKETTRIGIVPLTHVAVGKSAPLSAYREYRFVSNDPDAVYASSPSDQPRETVQAKWSISDSQLAGVSDDGNLLALKPGSVKVKGSWENFETETTVKVMKNLPVAYLPQVTAAGTNCRPQSISLSLAEDRALSFRLGFDDAQCGPVKVEAKAPDGQLPWKIEFEGGALELTKARGPIVSGAARLKAGGAVEFTAWAEGEGIFPISLANKTILLTGDSMSEGIGWSFRDKVEAAGGKLVVQPVYSSTTVKWQAERRLSQYIAEYRPDIVFIALGSNEIFTSDMTTRSAAVRSITAELGDIPAYWIGPPSWKPDHGIVRTIEENFRPGYFYNSNSLVVPRRKDGAHPTVEGYVTWTELIWKWWARTV
ncbi:MAG TPA: SGNH/GDSL hydrolase family protein [Pyrinomonadaceae bacterium]|nr:SGNH/GDSL hydrolase family protein [Pyrinomonadaceae bacterium]